MQHLAAFALLAVLTGQSLPPSVDPNPSHKVAAPPKMLAFTANEGQWAPEAKFLARIPGLDVWVTSTGFRYDFYRMSRSDKAPTRRIGHVVGVDFIGANPSSRAIGNDRKPGYLNYLVGDNSRWTSYVKQYGSARVRNLYPGIDLVAYRDPKTGSPRYDVSLKPHADLAQVRMRYDGVDNLRVLPNGQIAYDTSLGTVFEKGLTAYEVDVDGRTKVVPAKVVLNGGVARFDVPQHDPSKPLVIDPIVYSSFLGGQMTESVASVAVSSEDCAFVTGYTNSTDYPTTPGAYDRSSTGYYDVFVTKMAPDGVNVVYSTVLGGNNFEVGSGIAVDSSGSAYVTGNTSSTDFPTKNGYQMTFAGGQDAFVTKLKPDGSGIVYSTFVGGTGSEYVSDLALDDKGRAYVVGNTYSTDFPTVNAVQATNGGGNESFLFRVSPNGSALNYSTYFGGTNDDVAFGVAVDDKYHAVVVGYTTSTNLPTVHPYQGASGGNYDGFVFKMTPTGSDIVFSTYLGGASTDEVLDVATDKNGAIYMTGYTYSNEFPVTKTFGYSPYGGYVLKMPPNGSAVSWSDILTYSYGNGVDVTPTGQAYVTGYTYGSLQATPGAFQPLSAGNADAYIAKISADGNDCLFASYLGGSQSEFGRRVAVGLDGNAYVVGDTQSIDFPAKTGSYDTEYVFGDYQQGFVTRIKPTASSLVIGPISQLVGGTSQDVNVYLPENAPSGGVTVNLSTPGKVLKVPSTMTIPEGTATGTFVLKSNGVDYSRFATVNATLDGVSTSAKVLVLPAVPKDVNFSTSSVVGGSSTVVTGKVLLTGEAGPSGLVVQLDPKFLPSVSNPATIPYTVTVPAGASKVSFPVTHSFTNYLTTMEVVAVANGSSAIGKLLIKPSISAALSLNVPSVYGGGKVTGTITLSAPAPSGGLVFDLSTDSTNASPANATAKVAAGNTTVKFVVNTQLTTKTDQKVKVTAASGDIAASASFQLLALLINNVSLNRTTVVGGSGTSVTFKVTLNALATKDVTVNLSSSDDTVASLPATATINKGTKSVTVNVTHKAVATSKDVDLSASFNGTTKKATLTVTP